MSTIIFADRVITGRSDLTDAWVAIEGVQVLDVGTGSPPPGQIEKVDGWLIPGFVDMHVHGGGGGSFSKTEVLQATSFHNEHGTTTMLASLVSENLFELKQQIQALQPFVAAGDIAGIHLEGPFIAERRCGAHDPEVLCEPTKERVEELLAAGAGNIRIVTIAPELEGAQSAIATLASHGVLVALGHSDGTAHDAHCGVNAGASVVTHLFNGMRPLHHRETGLADVGILDSRLICELILDGHHLSDEMTKIALQLLGDRWIAITDAVSAAGAADGTHSLGSLTVEARDGVVRVQPGGALAGSTLTMDRAFTAIIEKFHRTPLEAVQATSTRPAALLQRHDIGVISPGARADFVVWQRGSVNKVMRAGKWL